MAHAEQTPSPQGSSESSRRTATRRALLCAGCALPLLAACSATTGTPAAGGSTTTASTSPKKRKEKNRGKSTPTTSPTVTSSKRAPAGALVQVSDVPKGGGVILYKRGYVVTQPRAGVFHGFSTICTHAGCQVGIVRNGVILCPCHGSEFSISDGSVVRGPARRPLPAKGVAVKSGWVVRA